SSAGQPGLIAQSNDGRRLSSRANRRICFSHRCNLRPSFVALRTRFTVLLLLLALRLLTPFAAAQGLDPAALLKPATDTWPTYNGDYSGRRFSTLDQINSTNIASLTLAWAFPVHIAPIKSTPLEVGGILYFTTMAPLVVRDHVIVGVSGDVTDVRGFLESLDPETGAIQWRWYTEPDPGQPGSETWPKDSDAILHGGGMTWMTGTYDPELNLLYWGTGNPNPVLAGEGRPGDNLYTCSIVALNPDTGKLVWFFQPSPHDVHDWDAVETPVLFDANFNGKPRKLLAQASRNS